MENEVSKKKVNWTVLWTMFITAVVLTTLIVAGTIGKANAACRPGSSDACPFPAEFQKKFNNGFFSHANGIPVNRAFNNPSNAKDVFTNKFKTYFNNHPKMQEGIIEHAQHLASKRKFFKAAVGRNTCFFPLNADCMAALEWKNQVTNAECAGWHSFPDTTKPASCDRFQKPTSNQEFLTKDELQKGMILGGCAVASGIAIVTAVGGSAATGGAGAPLLAMSAGAVTVGCVGVVWETVSP